MRHTESATLTKHNRARTRLGVRFGTLAGDRRLRAIFASAPPRRVMRAILSPAHFAALRHHLPESSIKTALFFNGMINVTEAQSVVEERAIRQWRARLARRPRPLWRLSYRPDPAEATRNAAPAPRSSAEFAFDAGFTTLGG
jgi:hypothetical protein